MHVFCMYATDDALEMVVITLHYITYVHVCIILIPVFLNVCIYRCLYDCVRIIFVCVSPSVSLTDSVKRRQ